MNWRTTGSGIIGGILMIMAIIKKLMDGQPISGEEIMAAGAIFSTLVGLFHARDAKEPETIVEKTTEVKVRSFLWLALLLPLIASSSLACTHHTPYVRFAERVQLAAPGATVKNEVTFRNTDSCDCARDCFTVSYGPHFPQPGYNTLQIDSTSLENPDGTTVGGAFCLRPGEERTAFYVSRLNPSQTLPAYVNPSLMVLRRGARWVYPSILRDWFDAEGGVLASGFSYEEARAFTYEPAPSY